MFLDSLRTKTCNDFQNYKHNFAIWTEAKNKLWDFAPVFTPNFQNISKQIIKLNYFKQNYGAINKILKCNKQKILTSQKSLDTKNTCPSWLITRH